MPLPKDFPTYAEDCRKAGGDPDKLTFILARRLKRFTESDPTDAEIEVERADIERGIAKTTAHADELQRYMDAKFGRQAE